jgi:carotenoid cleavage dioxygenase
MTLSRRQLLRMASGLAAATVAGSLTTFRSLAESANAPNFLTGHFRPVEAETTAFDLPVRARSPRRWQGVTSATVTIRRAERTPARGSMAPE